MGVRGRVQPGGPLLDNLEAVILDDRVAEELVAGLVETLTGGFLVLAAQLDLQVFADMHRPDPFIAHVGEGVLHCLALGIQDGLLRGDDDLCFHIVGELRRVTCLVRTDLEERGTGTLGIS